VRRTKWNNPSRIFVASIAAISAFFWLFNPNFWVPALVSVTLKLLVLHAPTRDYYVDEEVASVRKHEQGAVGPFVPRRTSLDPCHHACDNRFVP